MIAKQPSLFGAAFETRMVEDVDAISLALVDGLQGEYVQLESQPFRGRWTSIRWPSLVAQFGTQEAAVARRVRTPADRCAFIVPLAVPATARWNGQPVRPGDLLVCPPRGECLAFDPRATAFAILTVSASAPLLRNLPLPLVAGSAAPRLVACGADTRLLRERLVRARDAAESRNVAALSDGGIEVEALLRACLERAAGMRDETAPACSRSRIVRRAEEFFRTHVSEGVSVAQLSTVAGVSERSLRNAFYEVYTTSPKRYMKLWQLHQVRRALRAGDIETTTVTEAATCHGFYELGRFAGAYKSLFGEAPSETLSKARHRQALQGAA